MGGTESKTNEEQTLSVFTPEEKQNIHDLFSKITSGQKSLTEPFLQKYLPPWFEQLILDTIFPVICMCQNSSNDNRHVSELQFGNFLAQLLKGTYTERACLLCLLNGGRSDCAILGNLLKMVA